MSLAAGRSQISALTKELLNRWQQTKENWRDEKSLDFQSKYMEPLDTQVNAAIAAIEKLDKVLNKVRSDCE